MPRKRADARRNEATLLDAAAAAFVESGVNVPVRDIAARAGVGVGVGVGVGTIYRHFPTRADLIVAVYLRSDDAAFQTLHAYVIDRLVPVCGQLLEAAAAGARSSTRPESGWRRLEP